VFFMTFFVCIIYTFGYYLQIAITLIRVKTKYGYLTFIISTIVDCWIDILGFWAQCQSMVHLCTFEVNIPGFILAQYICHLNLAMVHLSLLSIVLTFPISMAYQVPSIGRKIWPRVAYLVKTLIAIAFTIVIVCFEDWEFAERP